jgi:hypothetical protein
MIMAAHISMPVIVLIVLRGSSNDAKGANQNILTMIRVQAKSNKGE